MWMWRIRDKALIAGARVLTSMWAHLKEGEWKDYTLPKNVDAGESNSNLCVWVCVRRCRLLFIICISLCAIRLCFVKHMLKRMCLRFSCAISTVASAAIKSFPPTKAKIRGKTRPHFRSDFCHVGSIEHLGVFIKLWLKSSCRLLDGKNSTGKCIASSKFICQIFHFLYDCRMSFSANIKATRLNSIGREIFGWNTMKLTRPQLCFAQMRKSWVSPFIGHTHTHCMFHKIIIIFTQILEAYLVRCSWVSVHKPEMPNFTVCEILHKNDYRCGHPFHCVHMLSGNKITNLYIFC